MVHIAVDELVDSDGEERTGGGRFSLQPVAISQPYQSETDLGDQTEAVE